MAAIHDQENELRHVELTDVIVATMLPFDEQGGIDWDSYRRLLDYCATPASIGAVFVNGHAGEGAALTREERIRVIETTRDYLGRSKPLLAGVIPYCTREAVEQAKEAKVHGADVAVLFPMPRPPLLPIADEVATRVARAVDEVGLACLDPTTRLQVQSA